MRRSRWSRAALVLPVVGAMFIAACGGGSDEDSGTTAAGTELTTVRTVVTAAWAGQAAPYIAEAEGFFAKRGIKSEFQTVSVAPLVALGSGDLDVVFAGPSVAVSGLSKGQPIRAITSILQRSTLQLWVTKDAAAGIGAQPGEFPGVMAGLKGKTFGVTAAGGQTDLTTRYLALQAGLNPDQDITITAVGGGPQVAAAIVSGRIDAAITDALFTSADAYQGKAVNVLDFTKQQGPADYVEQSGALAVVNEDYLNANKDLMTKWVEGVTEAQQFIADPANADKVVEDLMKYLPDIPKERMTELVTLLQPLMSPVYTQAQLEAVVRIGKQLGTVPESLAVADAQKLLTDIMPQ